LVSIGITHLENGSVVVTNGLTVVADLPDDSGLKDTIRGMGLNSELEVAVMMPHGKTYVMKVRELTA
jgi:hypothetical protein